MKRKRETKAEGGEICKLGSEWTSKRKPPHLDNQKLTTLSSKFMSSRPSARKSRLSLANYFNTNSNSHFSTTPQFHAPEHESDDTEGDWISQLGANYMTRKKLYSARGVPLSDFGAHFSPREHELELDNELDNAWIADFGKQWMRRRCRTRRGQYKVRDDAWICELGFQWMSRAPEREHANQTWLSDLSEQYMTRRKREMDRGIEELGLTAYRGFLEREPAMDHYESVWETRRKLQYSDPDSEVHMKRSKNGDGAAEFQVGAVDKHEVEAPEKGPANGVNDSQAGVDALRDGENVAQACVDAAVNGVDAAQAGVGCDFGGVQDGGENLSNRVEQEAKLIDDSGNRHRLVVSQDVGSEFGLQVGRDEVEASDGFQMLEFDPSGDLEPAEYVNLGDDDDSNFSSSGFS